MNNLQRLRLEIKDIEMVDDELSIYLEENGLTPHDSYNPQSQTNKKEIYQTTLAILEMIANSPKLMKDYKVTNDVSVSQFHENLMARIDQLERKIRTMATDKNNNGNTFMLFNQ